MAVEDVTVLLVGHGVVADGLARRLPRDGVELERSQADGAAAFARVAVPDLVVLAGDSARDAGDRVLQELALEHTTSELPVLVICAPALAAMDGRVLRRARAVLAPEGGLDVCAERIHALLPKLGELDAHERSLQRLVDEIAGTGKKGVLPVAPAPAGTGAVLPFPKVPPLQAAPPATDEIELYAAVDEIEEEVEAVAADEIQAQAVAERRHASPTPLAWPLPPILGAPRSSRPRALRRRHIHIMVATVLFSTAAFTLIHAFRRAAPPLATAVLAPKRNVGAMRSAMASMTQLAYAPHAEPTPAVAPTAPVQSKPPTVSTVLQQEPAVVHADDDSAHDATAARSDERPELLVKRDIADDFVGEGHRLLKHDRLDLAEAQYLKALQTLPDYPRAQAGLVRVQLRRKDGALALRWAQRLVRSQPKRSNNQLLLGDAYSLHGELEQARDAWRRSRRMGNAVARERLR